MRSIWKGAIQFGLVTIPVKLYAATDASEKLSFNMLCGKDMSRIQMKVYCPVHNDVIERTDTIKGYEVAPGQYIPITDADLASVRLPTLKTIEIKQFVKRDMARFTEKVYYLEPEPIGVKVFALLRAVLKSKALSAIGKLTIRERESLVAIDVFGPALMLATLPWPDEIRPVDELKIGDPPLLPAELKMGEQLVDAMTSEFDAANYHDEYKAALMKVIDAKAQGVQLPPTPEPATPQIDLMEALMASMAVVEEAKAAPKKRKERK